MENSATAGHFVFLGPCPAARHLVKAFSKSSVFNFFSVLRVLKLILKMHFQNSRISTVTFRDILVNSFMTYRAIDFDRYSIFTSIVLLFVV